MLVLKKLSFSLALLLLVTNFGCVRLLGAYDPLFTAKFTPIVDEISRIFYHLEQGVDQPEAQYEQCKPLYSQLKKELFDLKFHVDALKGDWVEQNQIQPLIQAMDKMEKIHQIGLSSQEAIPALKQPILAALKAIQIYQTAKQRR